MRFWGWWRRDGGSSPGEFPDEGRSAAELAQDELLSAYLDGEVNEAEAAAVERRLEADLEQRGELEELRVLRDALSELGELRAPRPFTLEAPPERARSGLGRLELAARMGAVAAAVAFAVVLTGDIAGLSDDGGGTPRSEPTGAFIAADAEEGGCGPTDGDGTPAATPQVAAVQAAPADDGSPSTEGRDSAIEADAAADDGAVGAGAARVAPSDETRPPPAAPDASPQALADAPLDLTALPGGAADATPTAEALSVESGAGAEAPASGSDAETPAAAEQPGEDASGREAESPPAEGTPVASLGGGADGADDEGDAAAEEAPLVATETPQAAVAAPSEATAAAAAESDEEPLPLTRPASEAEDDGDGVLRIIELALLLTALGLGGVVLVQRLFRRGGGEAL